MTAPAFGATDVLALGADWEPVSNSPASAGTRVTAGGNDGDVIASNVHNTIESGSAAYIYTGAETSFIAAWAAANCRPGELVDTNTLMVLSLALDYSPCAAGKRPLCTFGYRDGPTAAPTTPFWYTTALVLPTYTAANIEVPESVLTLTLGDAELQNLQWGLGMQFDPSLDKDGDYLAGQGFGAEETLDLTFVGLPTSITSTGWDQTSGPGANTGLQLSNTGYDQSAYQFVRGVTRST